MGNTDDERHGQGFPLSTSHGFETVHEHVSKTISTLSGAAGAIVSSAGGTILSLPCLSSTIAEPPLRLGSMLPLNIEADGECDDFKKCDADQATESP